MRLSLLSLLAIGSIIFNITKLNAQNNQESAEADIVWDKMYSFGSQPVGEDKIQAAKNREMYSRKFLEDAYAFWNRFPNDERRYIWLTASQSGPGFWKDIQEGAEAEVSSENAFYSTPIDWELFNRWGKIKVKLRKNALEDPAVSEEMKQRIRLADLVEELSLSRNAMYRGAKAKFIERVKSSFENAFSQLHPGGNYSIVHRNVERFFFQSNWYGVNMDDLVAFATYFRDSGHREIKEWAKKKLAVFTLRDQPFELKHKAVDGRIIDMAKLRGKVVLVDFWSNTCTVCIKRMPFIKKIYDKYKGQGFTVISAATNPGIDRDKILAIHEKIGADWPVLLLGGNSEKSGFAAPNSIGDRIFKKYGFSFVPQLLLFDRQGKLAMYNGALMSGDFEPMVKNLLEGKPAISKKDDAARGLDIKEYESQEDFKDFSNRIQKPYSKALDIYRGIVRDYVGQERIFTYEDFKNRKGIDSLKMAIAQYAYKAAVQTYIKNTILWICQHPDALCTPQLIMMWWPKDDWQSAFYKLTLRAQQSLYGRQLKDRIDRMCVISSKIEDLPDDTRFYLVRTFNNKSDTIQWVKCKNGEFLFQIEKPEKAEVHFILMDTTAIQLQAGKPNWIRLLLDSSLIKINSSLKEWPNVSIEGSAATKVYEDYHRLAKNFITKINNFNADKVKMGNELYEYQRFVLDYIAEHKDSYATPLLVLRNQMLSIGEKDSLFNTFLPAIRKSFYGKQLAEMIETQNRVDKISKIAENNNQIPDFSFTDINNNKISILSIAAKSEYTLIDFWASWCAPCRAAVPKLKKAYTRFHKRGFNIVSISTDTQEIAWKKALQEDKTSWNNGIDNIVRASKNIFPLAAIPAYILIDSKGKIVQTDYFLDSGLPGNRIKVIKEGQETLSENLEEILEKLL